MMKRRKFMTLLGGAAAAWPLAARAQQPERIRRIGMFAGLSETDPELQARKGAFLQALQQLGWTDGRNAHIDYRLDGGDTSKDAAELVALAPDVIVATGSPSVSALQKTTRTVPIVFVGVVDPVGAGFVASLARPAGNVTGFTWFEYGIRGNGWSS
jgi:putative tryptophan/tyrosine transport system substrate-binding protein